MNVQFGKWIRAVALPAAITLLVGGMMGPTAVLPSGRMAENHENVPAKEHCEELTVSGRFDQHRHVRLLQRSLAISTILSSSPPLGRAQHAVLDAPPGHRLPNGLLAPITC